MEHYSVLDKETGFIETVIDKTSNSYLVTQKKITEKGIDCDNWFDEKNYEKRFTLIIEKQ